MAETPDPIDVLRSWWFAADYCSQPEPFEVPVSQSILDALTAAGFQVVPIVDDATRQEVEDMVLGALPSRCPATLGKRPTWVGVDQYDPCSCRLPNGHDGDHKCSHGTESNNHPGEPKRLSPTVKGRPAELLADAYLGRNDG